MAEAKARRDASTRGSGRVPALVELWSPLGGEQLDGSQRIHLPDLFRVGGLVGEGGRIGEKAVRMLGKVGVEAGDEVLWGRIFFGMAAATKEQRQGECRCTSSDFAR